MRVQLTLQAKQNRPELPLSSNHAIAGLIYRILGQASESYAARLHDEGFTDEGRSFKLFSFSRLIFSRSRACFDRTEVVQLNKLNNRLSMIGCGFGLMYAQTPETAPVAGFS